MNGQDFKLNFKYFLHLLKLRRAAPDYPARPLILTAMCIRSYVIFRPVQTSFLARSITRQEKPHSLSYQERALTMVPSMTLR